MVCRFSGLLSVPPTCIQVKRLVPAVSCHILRASHSVWHVIGAQEISEWIAIQVRKQIMSGMILLSMSATAVRKAMAPHSSPLAWKIPWTEEPGGLPSMESHRVGQDWATSLSPFAFLHWRRNWQPTPVFLPGESQGRGSLVGCRLWGRTESDTTEAT